MLRKTEEEAEGKASFWMQISERTCNCLAVWMGYCGDDESLVLLEEQAFLTDLPHSHGAFIHPPSLPSLKQSTVLPFIHTIQALSERKRNCCTGAFYFFV
ncbi:uncharacterized [Tachysurus ichikawai]